MRKGFGALLCATVIMAVIGVATPSPAAAADASTEALFVTRLNEIRSQHGAGPLQMYGELQGIARGWADHMAAAGAISHNPSFSGQVSANWSKLGENVGVGASVDQLVAAFVKSPAHYQNIIDPAFTYIGVGVTYGADGRMYTTHDFMQTRSAPAPAPSPTVRTKTVKPPVVTPTTARASVAPKPKPVPATPVVAPTPTIPAPPPRPTPAADPNRIRTVLNALRAVGT